MPWRLNISFVNLFPCFNQIGVMKASLAFTSIFVLIFQKGKQILHNGCFMFLPFKDIFST